MDANKARGVQEIGKLLLAPPTGRGGRGTAGLRAGAEQDLLQRGATIYARACFSCHGNDGRGAPMAGAPAGDDDGAAARRLAARAGSSRLRHQGAARTA